MKRPYVKPVGIYYPDGMYEFVKNVSLEKNMYDLSAFRAVSRGNCLRCLFVKSFSI